MTVYARISYTPNNIVGEMSKRFERLLQPYQIRQVKLKNRMVKAPSSSCTADNEGFATERSLDYYEAVAQGGVGLTIIESAAVEFPLGASGWPRLFISDDKYIPNLAKVAGAIHKHDCSTFIQLHHAGPAHSRGVYGGQADQQVAIAYPVSSSSLTHEETPDHLVNLPRGLTVPEIEELVQKFASAAKRAQDAGFDGIELHFAHGYLVNSFLSRAWNKRQDKYGGDLENRARFAVEIAQAIRRQVGKGFVIGARINGREYGTELGLTPAESQEIARMLGSASVDYLSVTGWGYGHYHWTLFPEQILYPEPTKEMLPLATKVQKGGAFLDSAAAIKKSASIPVVAVGKLTPELGEQALKDGKADLIAFCRSLFADPDLPNKIATGRRDDIVPCSTCVTCFNCFIQGEPQRCRINAAYGKGVDYALKPAVTKKKVMVVGGGPAGMEAARVAAARGHEVILYEKQHKLGGLLPLAAMIKGTEVEDIPAIVRYLKNQIGKLGVRVELGKEVNLALVNEVKPDVVVIATGGIFAESQIPGSNLSNVLTFSSLHRKAKRFLRFFSPTLLRWLTRFWLPAGERVVIVGGSIHGCEAATFLITRGRQVTIVDSSNQLGSGILDMHRTRLLNWFAEKGAVMLTEVGYDQITDKGLSITTREGTKKTIEADTVLLALPPVPDTALFESIKGIIPEAYMVGDCKEPGLIVDAIDEASSIGRAI